MKVDGPRSAASMSILIGLMAMLSPAEAAQVCQIAPNGATYCYDDGSGGVAPGDGGVIGGGGDTGAAPAPAPAPKPPVNVPKPVTPYIPVPAPVYKAPAPSPVYVAPKPVYAAPKPAAPVYRPPVAPALVYVSPVQPQPVRQAPAASAPRYQAPAVQAPVAEPIKKTAPKPVAATKQTVKKVQTPMAKQKAAVSKPKINAAKPSPSPSSSPNVTESVVAVSEVRSDESMIVPFMIGGGLAAALLAAFGVVRRKRSKRL